MFNNLESIQIERLIISAGSDYPGVRGFSVGFELTAED